MKNKPYKKDEKTEERNIKNYENNLKLKYENIRKCIDIQLTSFFPHQDNMIRNYFWINFAMLGIMFTLFFKLFEKPIEFNYLEVSAILIVVFFLVAILSSVIYCIRAIIVGAEKAYGSIENMQMNDIAENEYTHVQGLINTLEESKNAFNMNYETITKKAKILRKSLICIYFSFISLVIFIVLLSLLIIKNNMEGGIVMAEKPVEKITTTDSGKVTATTATIQQTNSNDGKTSNQSVKIQITESDKTKKK